MKAKPVYDWRKTYHNIITAAADDAARTMRASALAGIFQPLTLYYKPATRAAHGQLFLAYNAGADWIDTHQQIQISLPYANYWQWIEKHSANLPIISFEVDQLEQEKTK